MTATTAVASLDLQPPPSLRIEFTDQLYARFDPALGALWLHWNPRPRPCFNPPLLEACAAYAAYLSASQGRVALDDESSLIKASILTSDVPRVFNLGGDLDLFAGFIADKDKDGLLRYGMACVDSVYNNYISYGLPILTVSLVKGECLGGGFEAALSSDMVIAERSARFGFPEILFNLFPGMGALSFVIRRCGHKVAEAMTSSGTIYTAQEMLNCGVIDMIVDDGLGEAAVNEYLRTKGPRMRAIFATKKRVSPVTRAELDDIVNIWVETALQINPRDLKLMGRFVARQGRLQ